jgi:hypothetical protein
LQSALLSSVNEVIITPWAYAPLFLSSAAERVSRSAAGGFHFYNFHIWLAFQNHVFGSDALSPALLRTHSAYSLCSFTSSSLPVFVFLPPANSASRGALNTQRMVVEKKGGRGYNAIKNSLKRTPFVRVCVCRITCHKINHIQIAFFLDSSPSPSEALSSLLWFWCAWQMRGASCFKCFLCAEGGAKTDFYEISRPLSQGRCAPCTQHCLEYITDNNLLLGNSIFNDTEWKWC